MGRIFAFTSTQQSDSETRDPDQGTRSRHNRLDRKRWQSRIYLCFSAAFIVFLINLTVTIAAIAKHGLGQDYRQMLYEGDCDTVRKLNVGVHVIINALSTILLASSNYCMQCLSAPTREEVDRAHASGRWLDIGILSTRNLRAIQKRRALL